MEAISGEPLALMKIVKIYEPYIDRLSLRMVVTEDGEYKEQVDETVKKTLETSLIAAIIKFDPCIQKNKHKNNHCTLKTEYRKWEIRLDPLDT